MNAPLTPRSRFGPKPRPEIIARDAEIIRRAESGDTLSDIARAFGLVRQHVDNIVNRRKFFARQRVRDALVSGRLVKSEHCERCGAVAELQAHHRNYDEPLVVEWICCECHEIEHHGDRRERDNRVRDLHAAGLGTRRIADAVGISRTLVRVILGKGRAAA